LPIIILAFARPSVHEIFPNLLDTVFEEVRLKPLTRRAATELVSAVLGKYNYLEIGVHLHSRTDQATEKILAAYDAGCRRFDSAIGGLGGCPFAQDALVGNIPTEKVLAALQQRGAQLPAIKPLDTLLRISTEIGARYAASHAADL